MDKIKKIIIGTNNEGKYREIKDLLPSEIEKYSPKDFNLSAPEETGKTFEENSLIKASYFSGETSLVCIADDSGLEIDALNGRPGIYSARWAEKEKNFDLAIEKVFKEINKVDNNWKNNITASFTCSMTIYWPNGKNFTAKGVVNGKISPIKKGKNGFGYDPIFIPNGYEETFGEMEINKKMSIDHRSKAFKKLEIFFN